MERSRLLLSKMKAFVCSNMWLKFHIRSLKCQTISWKKWEKRKMRPTRIRFHIDFVIFIHRIWACCQMFDGAQNVYTMEKFKNCKRSIILSEVDIWMRARLVISYEQFVTFNLELYFVKINQILFYAILMTIIIT